MVNFLKYKIVYFFLSFLVIGVGFFSIIKWGYRYSIDFVGGTNLEFLFSKKIDKIEIEKVIKKNQLEIIFLELKDNRLIFKTKPLDQKQEEKLKADLEKASKSKITVLKSETVGPILGRETMIKTIIASLLAILGILVYMTFAFKGINYALAAILAMIHDFFVVIGSYSLLSHFFGAEVDTMFVTAVLTTMSFSVHDTIVIFDKIREYLKKEAGSIDYFANKALTETMVRSLNNSMTIIFMLLSLSLMGGSTTRFFIITLLIGTITGTYSSPFVATPILVFLEKIRKK